MTLVFMKLVKDNPHSCDYQRPMGYLWLTYGQPIGYLPIGYLPMGYLWATYGRITAVGISFTNPMDTSVILLNCQ